MTRRVMIKCLSAALILVVVGGVGCWMTGANGPARSEIKNVLIISIDTCRADRLSCYGYNKPTTPSIDAVARDGVLFRRAQSTNPITLPSHCSLLTGTYPPFHGVHGNIDHALDGANVTLAELLQGQGYQTGAVVAAFPLDARFGLDQGFDDYDGQFSSQRGGDAFNERSATEISDSAIAWLNDHAEDPFFLFVHYFDPHQPYQPPEPFASRFPGADYDGEIAYTDEQVGRVIDRLKELGLYDSTLIIITSDHGESLGEHGEYTHVFFIYQSTIHVPLIIKVPGGRKQLAVEQPVSIVDVMPTVLQLLGQEIPPTIQGVDLTASVLQGKEPAGDRALYSESWYPAKFGCCALYGITRNNWRYIRSVRPELYDLAVDPREMSNLAGENLAVVETLQEELAAVLETQPQTVAATKAPKSDQATVQRLQSLGYVGGGSTDVGMELTPDMHDPKDTIEIFNAYVVARNMFNAGRLAETRQLCMKILAQRSDLVHVHVLAGDACYGQQQMKEANDHYKQVVAVADKSEGNESLNSAVSHALNNLAWVGSASADAELRNEAQAVEYAERAAEITGYQKWSVLDTLAVAYAANGQFSQAVDTANKAIALCVQNGEEEKSLPIRERLKLFKKSLPFREDPT